MMVSAHEGSGAAHNAKRAPAIMTGCGTLCGAAGVAAMRARCEVADVAAKHTFEPRPPRVRRCGRWARMFGLLYGLWRQLSSKPCYYVLIAGLDGAGKTVMPRFVLRV